MGQYIVQAPDGGRHVIEGPDDATPDQIASMAPKLIPNSSVAPKSQPEPDATGIFGQLTQMVRGKHDPAYAGIPSVYSQFPDQLSAPTGTAAILGASDPQMGDIVQKQLGDKFLRRETDANGYDVFVTKGPNGQEQKGYLNQPGLDMEDIARGVRGALPYMIGGVATKALAEKAGIGAIATPILQTLGATGTSVAGDKLQEPLGSQQGIERDKAFMSGVGAGAGEVVGNIGGRLYQRFIAEPRYFDRASGELTPLGKQAAQQLGLDPDQMAANVKQEFARTYAMNPADTNTAVQAASGQEFGIPSTIGQRSKDPEQLMLEKNLRYGLQGLEAKTIMQSLDESQKNAVEGAVTQTIPSRLTGGNLSGPLNFTPADYGSAIAGNLNDAQKTAKNLERSAWDQTGPLTAKSATTTAPDAMTPMTGVGKTISTSPAMPLLNDTLRTNLTPYANVISPENTPVAYKMWSYLNDFMAGKKPSSALHSALGLDGSNDIDSVRKAIGLMSQDAATATDRTVAKKIYDGFNDWMGKAADQGMLNGDTAAVTQFTKARDISREMNSIFKPQEGGKLTTGGKLLADIQANADTPERVVSSLFSGPKADIKPGAIEALDRIKAGFQRYLPSDHANAAWNYIRLAHWAKLTQGGNGEMLGYQAMKENLKNALNKQGTLTNKLYSPSEIAQIRRFVGELEKITYKDPNPSGSASGLGAIMRQFGMKVLDAIPFARAAFEYTGIPERHAAGVAKAAVSQFSPELSKGLPSYVNALVPAGMNALSRNQQGH